MSKLKFLFILCLSLSFKIQAKDFETPPLTGPVVDQVGLLSASNQNQIAGLIRQAHENNGPQVQVLIVTSLQDLTIEEFAIKIFDQWKLGDKKKDNGVLFLISPKDKKLRIEVGRGLEGDIPDAIAKRIVADVVRPYFKRSEYAAGVLQGVTAIIHYAQGEKAQNISDVQLADEANQPKERKSSSSKWIYLIVFLLWVLLFIFNPTLALAILFSGRGGGGSGGSSGGGWSGGGGSSAGGGASGDW